MESPLFEPMESPLFEPDEESAFELEDALLPQPTIPVQIAPTAPPMFREAPIAAAKSKKRKCERHVALWHITNIFVASVVDTETEEYFARAKQAYATLDPDAITSHDPSAEALPPLPAFDPAFAAAEKTASEIVCGVQQMVHDSGDTGSEATYMRERLASLVTPTYPKPTMICLYGNCAAGKSSLSNACLGTDGLSLRVTLS